MKSFREIGIITAALCSAAVCGAEDPPTPLEPILARAKIQSEAVPPESVTGDGFVAVGRPVDYALSRDAGVPFEGTPSYRFELRRGDNTIDGGSKGRIELSYCYATAEDFPEGTDGDAFRALSRIGAVYHRGKGIIPQGCVSRHRFSVRFPKTMEKDASFIFAQIHGMPERTLVTDPAGTTRRLSEQDFLALLDSVIFDKGVGYAKEIRGGRVRKGEANGWLVESGGFPPLAFGVSDGFLYVKCNSDRRLRTNLRDRTNTNISRSEVMRPVSSEFKSSVLVFKEKFDAVPRETWITFDFTVEWSRYGRERETVEPGRIGVTMSVGGETRRIVNDVPVFIGRNDELGYYFKFGIYRPRGDVPVTLHAAGYSQEILRR
ncbi:MAG: heparin lyase I family protein [Candidatus Spyradosoma sp.]